MLWNEGFSKLCLNDVTKRLGFGSLSSVTAADVINHPPPPKKKHVKKLFLSLW